MGRIVGSESARRRWQVKFPDVVSAREIDLFDEVIDVRSPVGVRRGPHPGRRELPGARRRRARARRHALQAGLAVRGEEARRGARVPQHRPPPRGELRQARQELAAARVLLARRQALGRDDARPARGRLAGGAARRRLQGLSARSRRASSRSSRASSATSSCAARPAARRAGCWRRSPRPARRCSTSSSSRRTAARCSATCPARRSPRRRCSRRRVWDGLRKLDPHRPVLRRGGEQEDRPAAGPGRAARDACARADCIRIEAPVEARVAFLIEEYRHFLADPAALKAQLDCLVALHGREVIGRWQAAGRPRRLGGAGRRPAREPLRPRLPPVDAPELPPARRGARAAPARSLLVRNRGPGDGARRARRARSCPGDLEPAQHLDVLHDAAAERRQRVPALEHRHDPPARVAIGDRLHLAR